MRYFLIFIILFLVGCSTTSKPLFWPEIEGQPIQQPIRLKIDESFTFEEELQIQKAIETIEWASDNKIKFETFWNRPKPGWFKNQFPLKENQGFFLWDLPRDYYNLTIEQKKKADKLLGTYFAGPGQNSGHIAIYDNIPNETFYPTTIHELLHLVGLLHTREKSIMHPYKNIGCLTEQDAIQLCQLYDCQPKWECSLDQL